MPVLDPPKVGVDVQWPSHFFASPAGQPLAQSQRRLHPGAVRTWCDAPLLNGKCLHKAVDFQSMLNNLNRRCIVLQCLLWRNCDAGFIMMKPCLRLTIPNDGASIHCLISEFLLWNTSVSLLPGWSTQWLIRAGPVLHSSIQSCCFSLTSQDLLHNTRQSLCHQEQLVYVRPNPSESGVLRQWQRPSQLSWLRAGLLLRHDLQLAGQVGDMPQDGNQEAGAALVALREHEGAQLTF